MRRVVARYDAWVPVMMHGAMNVCILPSVAFSVFCSGYFILLGVTQIWPHSIFGISNLIARRTYVHTS